MVSVSSVKGLLLTQSVVLIVLSLLLCWPIIFDALRRLLAKEPLLHSDYDLAPPDDAKEAYLIRCNIRVRAIEMAVPVQRSIAAMKLAESSLLGSKLSAWFCW